MVNATACSRQALACKAQHQQQASRRHQSRPAMPLQRRELLGLAGMAAAAWAAPAPAWATGIESVDLPQLELPEAVAAIKARQQGVLDDAEKVFQESDLLRTLKEKSEANRGARKRELEDRYCRRQAELGVGDCGGLRLIPGMTKSGVQKRPEFLNNLLGLPSQE